MLSMDNTAFREWLRKHIDARHINSSELAEMAGVDRSTINELGTEKPPPRPIKVDDRPPPKPIGAIPDPQPSYTRPDPRPPSAICT